MGRQAKKSRGFRSLSTFVTGAARSLTSRLARMAGLTERPPMGALEQLEDRRLMFALTVTAQDVNPQTGLGTVDAYFAYAIPYLTTDLDPLANNNPTTDLVDFNDTNLGTVTQGNPVLIPGSTLVVESNIIPFSDFTVDGQAPNNDQRWLRVNPGVGEFVRFSFSSDDANVNAPRISVQQFSIDIGVDTSRPGDNTGLVPNQFTVDVAYGTGATQSFTGAALQALFQTNSAVGVDTLVLADARGIQTVTIRRSSPAAGDVPSFQLDNAAITQFVGQFAAVVDSRIFAAHIELTGPVGASVNLRDLLGRDMRNTLVARAPNAGSTDLTLIDLNDDGIPDYNDGIGSITITGNDSRTAFSIVGGTVEVGTQVQDGAESSETQAGSVHSFMPIKDLNGFHDDFETAGFGYTWQQQDTQVIVGGLSPVGGSVIIGSPFVRNVNAYNPFGPAGQNAVRTGFTRADQGIFVDSGNMGRISAHAILHGSSRIAGFVNEVNVAYMVGSLTVGGDLGTAMFGTDAGMYSEIGDTTLGLPAVIKTNSQLTVGRTVGSLLVAGRNLMDVTVVGDVDSPTDRPARDSFNYYEKEFIFGVTDQTIEAYINAATNGTDFIGRTASDLVRQDSPLLWGGVSYRNDSLTSAEFLSTSTSGVRIQGELSGVDSINGEDTVDTYAFAAKRGQQIVIQATGAAGRDSAPYTRIMDAKGRTLSATRAPVGDGAFQVNELRWTPDADGVYFVVFTDPQGNDTGTGNTSYTAVVTGMAPVSFGDYRTGAGSGFTDLQNQADNSISVLSGDMGMFRVGMSLLAGGATEIDPTSIINTDLSADDAMAFSGGTVTVPGSLFQLATGSDIGVDGGLVNPVRVTVGGNLGQFYTGLSTTAGGSANEGDVNFFQLRVGGGIGEIRIAGGVGMDQDATDPRARITAAPNHVQIITGTGGGAGDIGMLRLGSHLFAGSLTVNTSAGSTIGAFLVSQDKYYGDRPGDGRFGIYRGNQTQIITGIGSDIVFADVPRFDLEDENRDVFFELRNGEALELTDDAGSRISITLTGVDPNATGNLVRVLPVDGSQGVVIAGIDVDLGSPQGTALGATLTISAVNPLASGRIGIGRITLRGGDATSNVLIQGSVEVDVYQIVQTGGQGFGDISNNTIGGDIVSADVASVRNITVKGNLGSTQRTSAVGPGISGPYIGFGEGNSGEG